MADNNYLRIVMRAVSIFDRGEMKEILCYPRGDGVSAGDFIQYIDHGQMKICSRCYHVYGSWKYKPEIIQLFSEADLYGKNAMQGIDTLRYQKCLCKDDDSPVPKQEDEEWKWLGFDYRKIMELCYCCGQELLISGSRWSVFFCDDCKTKVLELNRRFQRAVIPVGRHTLMNGIEIDSDKLNEPEAVQAFHAKANDMIERNKKMNKWNAQIVSDNLKALGCGNDIFVNDYLKKAPMKVGKSEAFAKMCDFLFMSRP